MPMAFACSSGWKGLPQDSLRERYGRPAPDALNNAENDHRGQVPGKAAQPLKRT